MYVFYTAGFCAFSDLCESKVEPEAINDSSSPNPGPLYGSLLRAWQAFLGASERLSRLHMEMQRTLVSEDTARIRAWQHDSYHRKLFGGFKEACELDSGFQKAQKPWTKKLKKVGGIWASGFF